MAQQKTKLILELNCTSPERLERMLKNIELVIKDNPTSYESYGFKLVNPRK
jgi:hypothetical protein